MSFSVYPTIKQALRPSQRLAVDEWLKTNVRLKDGPIIGPLDAANSPWIREPLMQLARHEVRNIICACSVQSSKTLFAEGALLYIIAEMGGDAGLYGTTDEHAQTFLTTRYRKRILACKTVSQMLAAGDRSIQKSLVQFAHMNLFVMGAQSIHNLQSKSLKTVVCDEAAYYLPNHLLEIFKRTTAYDGRNSKRVICSTPLRTEGDFYDLFQEGSRSAWHLKCPACYSGHVMMWENMKWDGARARLEDGKYDLNIVRDTIRYVCPSCGNEMTDDPKTRRQLANSGYYVAQNDNPDPETMSYWWNSLTVPWVAWHTVAAEFLKAQFARKQGNFGPLEEWVNKRLGQPWDAREQEQDEINLSGGAKMLETWDKEVRRYLTVDVQHGYFRVLIRLWARDGSSRLFFVDTLTTWEQIHDLQVKHSINSERVLVDCGFNSSEVYRQCAKYGWIAVKGDKSQFFSWKRKDAQGRFTEIKRPYSPIRRMDSSIGLNTEQRKQYKSAEAKMLLWSSDYIKLLLHRLRAGKGAAWETASDAPKYYFDEIGNETLVTEFDKKTNRKKTYFKRLGPNHSWDTESQQVLGACIEKLIGEAEIVGAEPDNKEIDSGGTDDIKAGSDVL